MKRFICITVSILPAILLLGCAEKESAQSPKVQNPEPYLNASAELAGELQKALGPRLMAALQEGGPEQAIAVCQKVAQELTDRTSQSNPTMQISRTALRYRNPLNAPDAASIEIMEDWEQALEAGSPIEPDIQFAPGKVIVHQPIMTAELCLQCHGDPKSIAPNTARMIEELYPDDEAINFAAGDLRGAFRIEFKE